MGTNYYLHADVCPHCGRCAATVHIGKSSGGWTFSFRGYRHDWEAGRVLVSYADWLAYLDEKLVELAGKGCRHEIRNEYGDVVSLEELKSLVESKRSEPNNHTLYCRIHHPEHARRECWLDDEGHSFSGGEFS